MAAAAAAGVVRQIKVSMCSVSGSSPRAPDNKPTQCHHMTGSSVMDREKSLLEAISFKWIYKETEEKTQKGLHLDSAEQPLQEFYSTGHIHEYKYTCLCTSIIL